MDVVQIILFATLAIELKRKAPNAHTFLEVIKARYGIVTHLVFVTFALMTNVLVTAMLLTGGSAVVTSLTGMSTPAACFLLPIGVVLYTLFGGIKATFLTDYVHTVMIIVIIFIFALTAYSTSNVAGSPGKMFDLLAEAASAHPVDGNAGGSYLTMHSQQGAIFFVINLAGNFGTVYLDSSYASKAISASPVHALPGYVLGGLAWFAIPWLCATTMGLSALALESNPVFPTFPHRMANSDVTAGLVLPNAAVALLGRGGAAATLLLIFMAVTSAMSAELIAVSSIATYDIFKGYFRPGATGSQLITVSHTTVIAWAVVIAGLSTGLYYIDISMGYLYLLMGVIISSAVLPASLTLLWNRQSWAAATFSPPLGLVCSLIAWLVTAKKQSESLTVASTGANNAMLAGNVVALLSPLIFVPILSLIGWRKPYDWTSMAMIRKGDDTDVARHASVDLELVPGEGRLSISDERAEKEHLLRTSKIARWLCLFLAVSLLVLWPMPMYGSRYVFSKGFFTGWVSVGILWLFCSAGIVVLYPLWESRATSARVMRMIVAEMAGKSRCKPVVDGIPEGEDEEVEKECVVGKQ
ncbi:MAG: hypothetical protein Q9159_007601 [Coniocarpon cinnabarinum]